MDDATDEAMTELTDYDLDAISEENTDFEVRLFDEEHRLHEVELALGQLHAHVNTQADEVGRWTPELTAERAELMELRHDLEDAGELAGVRLEVAATALEDDVRDLEQRIRIEDETL